MTTYIQLPLISKVKNPSSRIIGLMAVSILATGIIAFTVINQKTPKVDISKLTVPVTSKNVKEKVTASGKVIPATVVNISPKNSGILAQLYVEQGDKVEKGQIIAQMNSAEIQARILQYRANLAQAQAQLAESQAGGSSEQKEQARARLAQAQAELAAANAGSRPEEIAQAKARLAQTQAQLATVIAGNRSQEIEQAQAQVQAAQAQVELTQARVTRYQNLAQQGAISQDQFEQYVSEDKKAKASLQEAQRRLSLLQSGSRSSEIAQQQAAVEEARAALRNLENGTRKEEIQAKEASVSEARAALRQLENPARPEEIAQKQAAIAAVQAQLKAVQVELEDTIIRAPFSGIVTQKYATVGAFVTPTTSASNSASATSSSIVALARGLELIAQVPEVDIGKIKSGQQVEVIADAFVGEVFKGRVRLIAPEAIVEQNVTSFQVRVALDTGSDKLRSNMNVNLTFLGDRVKDALVIPTVAIVTENGDRGVLVLDANNQAQFRPVTIGLSIEDQTQILSGLKQGDRVFVNPPKNYKREEEKE